MSEPTRPTGRVCGKAPLAEPLMLAGSTWSGRPTVLNFAALACARDQASSRASNLTKVSPAPYPILAMWVVAALLALIIVWLAAN
jgi:hypothetical protein